jgi:hypothetical protein
MSSVPEFDDVLRNALARIVPPSELRLPVIYDDLSWHERKEVREEYARRQGNRCYHCQCDLDGPPPKAITDLPLDVRMFGPVKEWCRHPIHLHHNHRTGLTIGATHAYCNAVLAQYHGE